MLFPRPAGALPSQLLTHECPGRVIWLMVTRNAAYVVNPFILGWFKTSGCVVDKPNQPNSLIIICKCWQCIWHADKLTGEQDTLTDTPARDAGARCWPLTSLYWESQLELQNHIQMGIILDFGLTQSFRFLHFLVEDKIRNCFSLFWAQLAW